MISMVNEAGASHQHPARTHCTVAAVSRKIRYDISVQVVFPQDKRSDSPFYQNRALPMDYKPVEHLRCSGEVGWCLRGALGSESLAVSADRSSSQGIGKAATTR